MPHTSTVPVLLSGRNENLTVNSVTLDHVVREDVLLMKVDVEGWEWSVFKGAGRMMREFNVENIILEYSPGVLGGEQVSAHGTKMYSLTDRYVLQRCTTQPGMWYAKCHHTTWRNVVQPLCGGNHTS